ncbi:MAG TPA: ATP-binding protein, partial [Agathobacter rectalis]|nr:ATP-binding protein [Agathobacter rectalis]
MQNPFTLSFGKKPLQYISRISQTNQIVETFRSENPVNQLFMITGVRGSGKTVMMTNIVSEIKKDEEWLTVELNPTRDMLQSLAAKIYSMPQMNKIFVNAKLDFSAFGLGVSIENAAPVTDIENVLELMLENIKKHNKRLLISVDEVMNCEFVKVFVSSFQIFLRQDYPIFLLMTGLFENIYDLQNDKALTFLYRAPKIMLEPLSFTAVRKHYMDIFELDQREADKMAALTKGYPFAFQVLGYLYWE